MRTARIPGRPGLRVGPVGVLVRARPLLIGLGLAVIAIGMIAAGAMQGTLEVGVDRILLVMFGGGDDIERLVIGKRLVRTMLAVLVGAALGMAGAITQSLLRNPLASPDILGVSSGAGLAAVAVIAFPIAGVAAHVAVPAAAIVGGFATCALIAALALRRRLDPFRLVLVGIAVTALAGAATSWLLMRAELDAAAAAMRWLTGSVAGAAPEDVSFLAPVVVLGALVVAALARALGSLRLGADVARSLGERPVRSQILLALVAVVLVAVSVAVAGPVGFVAFVAPQVAMRLAGTAGPPPLLSALLGAGLVAGADLVARSLPVDLPVGVITSLVGAPVLLVLLFHSVRKVSA